MSNLQSWSSHTVDRMKDQGKVCSLCGLDNKGRKSSCVLRRGCVEGCVEALVLDKREGGEIEGGIRLAPTHAPTQEDKIRKQTKMTYQKSAVILKDQLQCNACEFNNGWHTMSLAQCVPRRRWEGRKVCWRICDGRLKI